MKETFGSRVRNAWNVFTNRDNQSYFMDRGYSTRPDRVRIIRGNEKSIVTAVYNRMALDAASININHCRLDDEDRFKEIMDSDLNNLFSLQANIDQTGRAFVQDIVLSMMNEGVVALVPVDTDYDTEETDSYNILSMRTGIIKEWFPEHVRVRLYNDRTGEQQDIVIRKTDVGIIQNPWYSVMNEPNSTMQRLIRKLSLLDTTDEQAASEKLDLIIQLPYLVKGEIRQRQAEERRKMIETQLTGSKYGIAYIDGTERITQLNRSLDNNFAKQVEDLTSMLYSQLSITEAVMDGTADDKTMLNYYTRTIEPIVSAIADEVKRKFLTKTARSQKQTVMYFRDPFKLVPINDLAEIGDKFTRNEILSSNEIRGKIGIRPSDDPKADQLVNSNLNQAKQVVEEIDVKRQSLKKGENSNGDT